MLRRLAPEDLALTAWNAVAVPILGSGAGAPLLALGEPATPIVGVIQLLAVLGALAAFATRPVGATLPRLDVRDGRYAVLGPMIGGIAFVAGSAASHLGTNLDGAVTGIAFLVVVVAIVLNDRLPTIGQPIRRALVLPFVLVCAGIFDAFAADLLRDVDLVELFRAATIDETGFGLFILQMLLAALGMFYAMFVVAPRVMVAADGSGSIGCVTWPLRFALFILSSLFGIGWLAVLGR